MILERSHTSRLPRAVAWIAAVAAMLFAILLGVGASRLLYNAVPTSGATTLVTAEAARARSDSIAPPPTGWIPVRLPNGWTKQWPDYDGAVWYRLVWNRTESGDAGLLIPWAAFSLQARVNGQVLHRYRFIERGLNRNLGRPFFLSLPSSMLRPGPNIIEIKVVGLASYFPGLSEVSVGPRAIVNAAWRTQTFWRREMYLISVGALIAAVMMYGVLMLVNREADHHRWFVLWMAAWAWAGQVALSGASAPFNSLDGFERSTWVAIVLMVWWAARALMAFSGWRNRPVSVALMLCAIALAAAIIFAPKLLCAIVLRVAAAYAGVVMAALATVTAYAAMRSRQIDQLAMAVSMAIALAATVHDILGVLGPGREHLFLFYYAGGAIAVASLVAHALRYAVALQRLGTSNAELLRAVADVRAQTAGFLAQAARIARQNERTSIAHDLRSGLGEAIDETVDLFAKPNAPNASEAFLSALRELRDDLTLIFEGQVDTRDRMPTLAEVLAPLRRRWVMDLGLEGIACLWPAEPVACPDLGPTRNLDLMRLINRALTNVAAHASARTVRVHVDHDDAVVTVRIEDDGRGFDPLALPDARGINSMRQVAARLEAAIDIKSRAGAGVVVRIIAPLRSSRPGRPWRSRDNELKELAASPAGAN